MRLQGQNFRILTYDSTAAKYKCIGMSTNCVVTQTNNTENTTHKDIVGMAQLPTVVSQGWSVQVYTLNVADVGAMLTAIKSGTPFTLMWEETSTGDNQTPTDMAVGRIGQAYLSDFTAVFNDRENSTKALQFQGTGPLSDVTQPSGQEIAIGSLTKGETVRLFLSSDNTTAPAKVIGNAKQLQLHVSLTLEQNTTKDTTGNWITQEPTELAYDITSSALMRSGETITSLVGAQGVEDLESIKEAGLPVKWQIANVSGANNRTKGSVIVSGSAVISQLVLNGPNRQAADYQTTLQGYGDYTVGS